MELDWRYREGTVCDILKWIALERINLSHGCQKFQVNSAVLETPHFNFHTASQRVIAKQRFLQNT